MIYFETSTSMGKFPGAKIPSSPLFLKKQELSEFKTSINKPYIPSL